MPVPLVVPVLGGLAVRAAVVAILRFLVTRLWVFLLLVVDWFKGSSLKTVAVLILILKAVGPIAIVAGVVIYMFGGLSGLASGLNEVAAQLEGVATDIQPFTVTPWVSFANRVFPLDLALGFLGVILTVRVIALGVRFIKSLVAGLGS